MNHPIFLHASAKTLWTDADKTRQFLIPDALQLPLGDFLLRTATGREQRVDPAALAPFEVSAEEARTWAKAQLGKVALRLKAGLKDALFGSTEKGKGRDEENESAEAKQQSSTTPVLDLLADITGTPREHLSGDYRAVGRTLRDYLKDIGETTGDALSGDPEREREAHQRMRDWAKTLRAHGIPAAEVEDPNAAPGDQKEAQDRDTSNGVVSPSKDGDQERKP
jgi:DNA-binding LacI/PurR family transcriptional regulator